MQGFLSKVKTPARGRRAVVPTTDGDDTNPLSFKERAVWFPASPHMIMAIKDTARMLAKHHNIAASQHFLSFFDAVYVTDLDELDALCGITIREMMDSAISEYPPCREYL